MYVALCMHVPDLHVLRRKLAHLVEQPVAEALRVRVRVRVKVSVGVCVCAGEVCASASEREGARVRERVSRGERAG